MLRLNSTTNETHTSNPKLKISLVTRTITLVKNFPVYILYKNPKQIVSFKQKELKILSDEQENQTNSGQ